MSDETVGNVPPAQPEVRPEPAPLNPPFHRRRGWPAGKRRTPPTEREKLGQEFSGMTSGEGWNSKCADVCNPTDGCYITKRTGSGICAHPDKGGLQSADMQKPLVVDRYNRARKYLAHLKVDRRA